MKTSKKAIKICQSAAVLRAPIIEAVDDSIGVYGRFNTEALAAEIYRQCKGDKKLMRALAMTGAQSIAVTSANRAKRGKLDIKRID